MQAHSLARSRDKELDEVLRDLGGTRLYRNNVFRLTGLPVTASAKQIRRRREEVALMAQLGAPPPAAPDGPPVVPAVSWDEVDAAFEAIGNPVRRLVHELLWLWEESEVVDHNYAVRRHCEVLEGQSLTAPGRPDMPNDPLGQQWLVAVRAWARVLSDEALWDWARQRVTEIDDPRLTTGTVRRLRDRLPRHIVDVHLALAAKAAEELGPEAADRHQWVLDESSFDDDLVDAALRDTVRPAEDRVRAACEVANHVAETAPLKGIDAGHTLLEQTEAPLRTIAGMLGTDDAVTSASHDEVATSVNLCAVAHDNETEASYPAIGLLRRARELARERMTIELIDKNMTVIVRNQVRGKVDGLCEAGKVNKAADRLRALRRHAGEGRLRNQIDAVLANPMALRTSPRGLPLHGSFVGWGAYLWGRRETTDFGKHIATHYLTVFFIPIIPMAAYLRDGRYIYGKVPLSRLARWWRLVALILAVALAVQPFQDVLRLLIFLMVVAGVTAMLGWRRYQLDKWAYTQVTRRGGNE